MTLGIIVGCNMNEKIYNNLKRSGVTSLVIGISTIVAGVAAGVLLIIRGAKLLSCKPDTLF